MCNNRFLTCLLCLFLVSVFAAACGDKENVCRTCTAKYASGGETIATEEACSSEEEDAFKSEFSGAAYTVSCR